MSPEGVDQINPQSSNVEADNLNQSSHRILADQTSCSGREETSMLEEENPAFYHSWELSKY